MNSKCIRLNKSDSIRSLGVFFRTLICVCVFVFLDWTLGWGTVSGHGSLARCAAILELREAFTLLLKCKSKSSSSWSKKAITFCHIVSCAPITFVILLPPQSHSFQTITNSCASAAISLSKRSFWLLFVSFWLSLPWGNDYPGYGGDIPVNSNVLWLLRKNGSLCLGMRHNKVFWIIRIWEIGFLLPCNRPAHLLRRH